MTGASREPAPRPKRGAADRALRMGIGDNQRRLRCEAAYLRSPEEPSGPFHHRTKMVRVADALPIKFDDDGSDPGGSSESLVTPASRSRVSKTGWHAARSRPSNAGVSEC